jgi:glutamine amidotransferase-like uncharacterized protein
MKLSLCTPIFAAALLFSGRLAVATESSQSEVKPEVVEPFVIPPDANGMKTIIAVPERTRPIKVGIYLGPGSPQHGVDNVIGVLKPFPQVTVKVLSEQEVGSFEHSAFDVLVFPGGSGSGQSKGIGETGLKNVRDFVSNGGGYVGICGGAYLACSNFSWSLGILNAGTVSSKWRRGHAMLDLKLTEEGPALLGDVKDIFKVRYHNGPILKPAERTDLPLFTPLTVFKTEIAENDTPVGVQVNSPAHVIAPYGKGRVFVSSPHPENTPGLENFIPRGVFWAAGEKAAESTPKTSFVVPADVNGMKTIIAPPEQTRTLKVGIYSGPGAPQSSVDAVIEVLKPYEEVTAVTMNGEQVATEDLSGYDVVVFPGGTGGGQSKGIGEAGLKNVREYVRSGGGYVGICAGAYLACSNFSWGLGILNAGTVSNKWRRGQAILELEMTSEAAPVLGEVKEVFKVRYNNGPILKPWNRTDIPAYTTLAVFRTEVAKYGSPEGVQVNSPSHVIASFGKGRVFVSSPHPEGTPGLENFIPRGIFWAAGEED